MGSDGTRVSMTVFAPIRELYPSVSDFHEPLRCSRACADFLYRISSQALKVESTSSNLFTPLSTHFSRFSRENRLHSVNFQDIAYTEFYTNWTKNTEIEQIFTYVLKAWFSLQALSRNSRAHNSTREIRKYGVRQPIFMKFTLDVQLRRLQFNF